LKKPNREKKKIKQNKILKKPTGRFNFGFISLEPKKLNRIQTEKTRKKTELNRKNERKSKKQGKLV